VVAADVIHSQSPLAIRVPAAMLHEPLVACSIGTLDTRTFKVAL